MGLFDDVEEFDWCGGWESDFLCIVKLGNCSFACGKEEQRS